MKRSPVYGALAFGTAFFLISWFLWSDNRHFIEGGDIFFPVAPSLLLSKAAHAWWPDQFGSVAYTVSAVPLYALFAFLQHIGFSAVAVDRFFLAGGYGVSSAAMYLLADRFWDGRAASWIAALWYPCGIYYCLAIPNENNVVALAIVPLLAYFALCALDEPLYIVAFDIVSIGLGFISANPPTLLLCAAIIVFLWIAGVWGRTNMRKTVTLGFALAGTAMLVNLWWIDAARAAVAANQVVAAGVNDWSWVLRRSTIQNVIEQTSFWGFGYGSDPWLTIGLWYANSFIGQLALIAMPTAAAIGVVAARAKEERTRAYALAVLCVFAIFLAKGTQPPLGAINAFLYRHAPLMFLYREPVKFELVLAFAYPLLAAFAFAVIYSYFRSTISRWAACAVFVGIALVTGWPLLSAWLFHFPEGQARRTELPSYWERAAAFINRKNTGHERVLILPEDGFYQAYYRWGLNGVDRIAETTLEAPVVRITADQNQYLANRYGSAMLGQLDRAFRLQDGSSLRTDLRRTSIGFAILRTDLVPDGRTLSPAESRESLLRAGARLVARFGALEIYKTPVSPALFVPRAVLRSCASPAGELAAAERLPLTVSVVRSDMQTCRSHRWYFQAIPRRGILVPAHTWILRATHAIVSAPLAKRHDVWLPAGVMYDVTEQVAPLHEGARGHIASRFVGNWRLVPQTGSQMKRCIRLGNASYISFSAKSVSWPYVVGVEFSSSQHCPEKPERVSTILTQRSAVTLATADVPVGSRSALIVARPEAGIGRADRPLPFIPSVTVRDIFPVSGALERAPVVYDVGLPLVSGMYIYGVSWPSDVVFRMGDGRELNAFVYRNGHSSPELPVANIFERIFQSVSSQAGRLQTSDVTVERIVPLSTTRLADRLIANKPRAGGAWSLTRTSHSLRLMPRKNEVVYAGISSGNGHVLPEGGLSHWWDRGQASSDTAQWIVMQQSFDPQWTASGAGTQGVANGYANAWQFPNAGQHHLAVRLTGVEFALGIFSGIMLAVTTIILVATRRVPRLRFVPGQFSVLSARRTRT